jgi:phenylpropionate dioxygenase-like ring-hydroxylating dioxygenase large terminal subunit
MGESALVVTAEQLVGEGKAIPSAWYDDPSFYAGERDAVFARTWQYLAHADQLAAPDSYLIAPVGDFAAVVLRGSDGSLRAFGTRRPRAYELPEETLLAAARSGGSSELEIEELRLETWEQCYIFGTFDHQAVSLAESLGPLCDKAGEVGLDYASLRHWERITYEVDANWKIVVENSVECYHCTVAHPELVDLMDMEVFEQTVFENGMVQEGPVQGDSRREEQSSGYSYPSGGVQQGRYMFFWPTFYLLVYPGPGNVSTMRFHPRGPGRTLVIRDFYFAADITDPQRAEIVEFIDRIQLQDSGLCASVQRGIRSGGLHHGTLQLNSNVAEVGPSLVHRKLLECLSQVPAGHHHGTGVDLVR